MLLNTSLRDNFTCASMNFFIGESWCYFEKHATFGLLYLFFYFLCVYFLRTIQSLSWSCFSRSRSRLWSLNDLIQSVRKYEKLDENCIFVYFLIALCFKTSAGNNINYFRNAITQFPSWAQGRSLLWLWSCAKYRNHGLFKHACVGQHNIPLI